MGVSAIVALPLLGAILPPLFTRAGRTPALLAALAPSLVALALLAAAGRRSAAAGAATTGAGATADLASAWLSFCSRAAMRCS